MSEEKREHGDRYVGYHVVCIVDVLGQRNKLAGWSNMPSGGKPDQAFIDAMKHTVGTVLAFKDAFAEFFARVSDTTVSEHNARLLTPEKLRVFKQFRECRLLTQQFSDTFVFF